MKQQINHLNSRQKNWVELNGDSRGMYNTNSQLKFNTTMLKSSLCDYSHSYILVKGTITVIGAGTTDTERDTNRNDKQAIFKN